MKPNRRSELEADKRAEFREGKIMTTSMNMHPADISPTSTIQLDEFQFGLRNPNLQGSEKKIPKIQPVIHETKDHKTIEVGPPPGEEFAP